LLEKEIPVKTEERLALEEAAWDARREADEEAASSWAPVNLAEEYAHGLIPDVPVMLRRDDGHALLYASKTHSFIGQPESGKTWAALVPVADEIRAGRHAFYVDFEDSAKGIGRRLVEMGVPQAALIEHLHYFRPRKHLTRTPGAERALMFAGDRFRPTVVVLDGVTEAMALHGWNANDAGDVALFYDAMPRRWERTGAVVVTIDHVVKAKDERGRYALGSQHKLAGLNGPVYRFDVESTLAPGRIGKVKMTVSKDREGEVRRVAGGGDLAGYLTLTPVPEREGNPRGLEVTVKAPSYEEDARRVNEVLDKMRAWLAEQEGKVSQRQAEAAAPELKMTREEARQAFKTLRP
jgi:hypothetical protein